MQDETIFADPLRRRWWLITKALENATLDDALKIAQAVDKFLTSGDVEGLEQQISRIYSSGRTREIGIDCNPTLPEIVVPHEPAEAGDQTEEQLHALPADETAMSEDPLPDDGAEQADVGRHPEPEGNRGAAADGLANLAVWASIDDVVRYLRQRDDVVVSNGDGQFLVNGRFAEDTSTLVDRANKVRHRHRKPPFQLVPNGFAPAG